MVTGTPPRRRRLALRLPSCRATQTSQQIVFTHAHKLRKSAYRERGLARRRAERNRGQTSESIRSEHSGRDGVAMGGFWGVDGRPRNDESGGISRKSQKRNARHWCTVSDAKMRCRTPSWRVCRHGECICWNSRVQCQQRGEDQHAHVPKGWPPPLPKKQKMVRSFVARLSSLHYRIATFALQRTFRFTPLGLAFCFFRFGNTHLLREERRTSFSSSLIWLYITVREL